MSGDGWTTCAAGHRHWGRFGAAGLLLRSAPGTDTALGLQLRAEWSHHGGTWGLLGGARDAAETPVEGALREAGEEASVDAGRVRVEASYFDDHGGWGYTTVVATAEPGLELAPRSAESDAVRWVQLAEMERLELHPGFARTWPVLRHVGPAPVVVVDAANVIGSRPDGWWRDRAGAVARLRDQLALLAAAGSSAAVLGGTDGGVRAHPEFVLVAEGAARDVEAVSGVAVVSAAGSGDDAVMEVATQRQGGPRAVVVVTADRELRERVRLVGAETVGPRTLLDLLPPSQP